MKNLSLSLPVLLIALTGCGGGSSSDGDTQPAGTTNPTARLSVPPTVNRGEVVAFDGSASTNADTFEWTLLSEPTGAIPAFDLSAVSIAYMAAGQRGNYTLQLIVSNSSEISEPAIATVAVIDAGPMPARIPIKGEVDELVEFAVSYIKTILTSPSSFQMVGEPEVTIFNSVGTTGEGSIRINFDAQNSFGAVIRARAICPIDWSGYSWSNTLDRETLSYCFI